MSVEPRLELAYVAVETEQLASWGATYNPRTIDAHQLAALRSSLRTFGAVEPVVVNRRSEAQGWPSGSQPCLVGGHQRVRAAQAEGFATMPVVWVELDYVRERQLNLALNRISGEWDEPKLMAVLIDLHERKPEELGLTGFDPMELRRLCGFDTQPLAQLPTLSDAEAPPFHTRTFILSASQLARVEEAVQRALPRIDRERQGNENRNGCALAIIVEEWLAAQPEEEPQGEQAGG